MGMKKHLLHILTEFNKYKKRFTANKACKLMLAYTQPLNLAECATLSIAII